MITDADLIENDGLFSNEMNGEFEYWLSHNGQFDVENKLRFLLRSSNAPQMLHRLKLMRQLIHLDNVLAQKGDE